jgi:hypothetical protein
LAGIYGDMTTGGARKLPLGAPNPLPGDTGKRVGRNDLEMNGEARKIHETISTYSDPAHTAYIGASETPGMLRQHISSGSPVEGRR